MQIVDEITCVNNGGFDMKFQVCWANGQGGWSDYYPNPESRSFNLGNFNIPDGTQVWITVSVALGKTHSSKEDVQYGASSTDNATYKVTGTADHFDIDLEGN